MGKTVKKFNGEILKTTTESYPDAFQGRVMFTHTYNGVCEGVPFEFERKTVKVDYEFDELSGTFQRDVVVAPIAIRRGDNYYVTDILTTTCENNVVEVCGAELIIAAILP